MKTPARCNGSALLVLFLLMIPVLAFTGWALQMGDRGMRASLAQGHRDRALYLAEAGVDKVLGTVDLRSAVSGTLAGTVAGTGTYAVSYLRGDRDLIDDDGDGSTDEADERDYFQVTSTGRSFREGRTIEALLRRQLQVLETRGAIYIDDLHPEVSLSGNAFRIDGRDWNIDGTRGAGPDLPGIGTVGSAAEVIAQIPSQRYDQITGVGGTSPNVTQVAGLNIPTFAEQVRQIADLTLTNPGTYTESLGNAANNDYKVVYVQGDMHISGGTTGAGILVVNGNLTISGGWEYVGIVVVVGTARFTGGGSGKRLYGSLVVGQDVETGGGPDPGEVELTGTVDVLYSAQAISLVKSSLGKFQLVFWQERSPLDS